LKRTAPTVVREDTEAWLDLTDEQREAQARSTGEEDHAGIGTHKEPFLWYQRIAQLASAHGVKVIAVLYPAHAAYINSVTPEAERAVRAELAALGIHDILDFRSAFRDPVYFSDPDHVSPKGAVALLQLLGTKTGRKLLADTVGSTPAIQAAERE
jgi:hypothetical protein